MAMYSGGSFGDLSTPDEGPTVDSTIPAGVPQVGMGLQLRKSVAHGGAVTIKLENIKQERLKAVRETCSWATSRPQGMKLPPIPAAGEHHMLNVHEPLMSLSSNMWSRLLQ